MRSTKAGGRAVSRYLLLRLLISVPVLLGISMVLFAILALAPGDPFGEMALNPNIPPEVRFNLRKQFGLDDALVPRATAEIAGQRLRIDIQRVVLQRALVAGGLLGFGFALRLRGAAGFALGNAVHDVIHHVETGDRALVEEIHGMRFLFAEQRDWLEFYIVLVRTTSKATAPVLTPRLFMLRTGDRLHMGEKITGHFTLEGVKPDDSVIFLSTGTGEAPHNCMLLELLRNGHRGLIVSVVCVRYQQDLGYLETHQKILACVPNYRYITLTTREQQNLQNKLYIQDLIRTGQLEQRIGQALDPGSTHVFLCGNPNMIGIPKKGSDGQYHYPNPTGVIELLESRGFRGDRPREPGNIHFEQYW